MKFDLDAVIIEQDERDSPLARRVLAALAPGVPVQYVADGREAARPRPGADPFGAGKRRMVLLRRRAPFLMGCPAGSAQFACCGYQVMILASNCPMDCSYCFLQEFVADNPAFQVYSNYSAAFDEIDRMIHSAPARQFRIGTGELADSLAFDTLTGLTRDLVPFFAARQTVTLELKTKTDEIDHLLELDPRGRVMVSWTLSPERVWRTCEHRAAPPAARIAAARKVLEAGYRVAFHFDPILAYDGAERDYAALIDNLLDVIAPARIAFFSMGGLRMTPALKSAARRRFPADPMLLGEDVLARDGRLRAFTPLRLRLYRILAERFERAGAPVPGYLCMEAPSVHERVFGATPPNPATLGARLAHGRSPVDAPKDSRQ
ncbi:MAG TPA: radical SAM protein [Candidatus Binataceae bacterium]|nr:radical SAM protein [Candidatus Binataceae bacterium]